MFERPFLQKTQRAVPPPADVREEWEFLRDLAAAIGLPIVPDALDITPDQMNDGMLQAIGAPSIADIASNPHGMFIGERHFGALRASLLTPDKRIHACPPVLFDLLQQRLAEPVERDGRGDYPYQIISRRRLHMMNTWLVETTAQDMRARPGRTIEISVEDAARDGLADGDQVTVSSAVTAIEAIVAVSATVRPGVAVMDHGWGSALIDPSTGAEVAREGVNRNLLVSDQDLDPLSGVARLNGTPISIARLAG
jgi:formate dehydrogenase